MGKIIRNGIEFSSTSDTADNINYNNSKSGLTAVTAQEAIDEVTSSIEELKVSFQDGCNTIYNAVVEQGVTPEDKTPNSIAHAILNLMTKKNFSVSFKVAVAGAASNNAGSVSASGNITCTLNDDGTLVQSDLSKSNSGTISYISNCNITGITLSDLTYDTTLDEITFKISTGISASNGSGTARGNASQSFKISNKTDVSAIDSMSKTSSTVTQINNIGINSITITIL